MAGTTQVAGGGAEAGVRIAGRRLMVEWTAAGELVLTGADGMSRVAGGPLVEVVLPAVRRVDETGTLRVRPRGPVSPVTRERDAHGEAAVASRTFAAEGRPLTLRAEIRVYDEHAAAVLRLTLVNAGAEPLALRRAFPFVAGAWWARDALVLAGRARELAAYKSGWQSWSYAGGLPSGRPDPRPRTRTMVAWHSPGGVAPEGPLGGAVDVVSEGMGMLGVPGVPTALLVGFLDADRWLGQVYAQRREGAVAAAVLLDGHALQPGEELALPLWLALGPQRELPTAYAEALARQVGARGASSVPTGWCSWYYYFTRVTEADVLANLATLRGLRDTLPVRLVQVDDGYQAAIGDWLSVNAKFPGGMKALAAQIREAGFRPGLWLAPFTVGANSRLAHEHPDWLVRDEEGRPAFAGHNWDTDLYGLDTTHPAARDWLRRLFVTVVREWGYDYLKLDFLACAALPGTRHAPGATRAGALRAGLALIREVVGDDVYILGCGCPLLSAVGIVDAMRIGPDSAPYWSPRYQGVPVPFAEGHPLPTMAGAVRNTLARAWMHPALWTNDPDCLLVREAKSELTLDEVRAFASAVGLTGGMVLVSDDLAELPPERLEIVARLLPPLPARALPLDYFDAGIPERVALRLSGATGDVTLVGLFNNTGGDREASLRWDELGFAPGAYHAAEFWSGAYLGVSDSGVSLRLDPHGAAVLAIRPARAGEPALLSTSFHISQGAVDVTAWEHDRERGELRWRSSLGRTARGEFLIWVPADLAPRRVTSSTGRATWRRNPGGEVVVSGEVRGETDFTLELAGA